MLKTAETDDLPKGAWIAILVVSFIVFWPLGLAVLGYLFWSGKMHNWKCSSRRRGGHRFKAYKSSGNTAFDDYRDETLKRLEEEQRAFAEFVDNLRRAKDQAEFDQFMAARSGDNGTKPDQASPDA